MTLAIRMALGCIAALAVSAAAYAQPIAGVTYTYDLSQADPGTGIFTTFLSDPAAQDPTNTKLTDGELGDDMNVSDVMAGCCRFNNGTWIVVQNGGFGGAPQPKIDVTLPGTFSLASVQLTYLVEDPSFIYAPQPQTGINALTVSGAGFSEFTNDFNPIFGTGGDSGTGVVERRSATVLLGGVSASQLSIDVRTPFTFIALGELIVNQVPEPATWCLCGLGTFAIFAMRRRLR